MAPVEQHRARAGNPDASHPGQQERRLARHGLPCVGASPGCVWRGRRALVASPGNAAQPAGAKPHGPRDCTRYRNRSCRDHSGCTGPPACGSAHTGTGGLSPSGSPIGPDVLDGVVPARHTAVTPPSRARVGRGALVNHLPVGEDRCRARLIRLGCVVLRGRLRRHEHAAPHPAARAHRGQVTRPQGKPVDGPFGVRDLPTAPRRLPSISQCSLEITRKCDC